ncbi:MAG TPA: tripartite tricarboxylate transporter substrate-binding protein [Burkholderiaceae bacterium]|nr:tripartite tricarboxylate transporter substrate-binding protein [Burkholderiaceae bacterium]
MTFNFHRRGLLAVLIAGAACAAAQAADRPPMRVIVPASAGSGIDTHIRAVVPSLKNALGGQAVVVENLPGAGGITGTAALVRAAPDGNTIALVSNNHAVNPSVYQKMPFDSLKDITPIAVVGSTPFLLVVNPQKVPAKTAKELQAMLKAKPGVDVKHIPYKGMAPMVSDIISGQVEMGAVSVPVALAHVKSGALRAIGVMGKQRVPSLPDLPTLAEQGFPEVDIAGWFAFIGPAKLPAAEVKRLHAAVLAAFETPDSKEAMAQQQNIMHPMTPEASAQFFRSEQERYAALVKKANVRID